MLIVEIMAAIGVVVAGYAVVRRIRPAGGGEPYVIGREMAAAAEAEKRWTPAGESPMPAEQYDFSRRETGLADPARLPLDDEIAGVARRFAESDDDARALMRGSISGDGFYELLTFGRRAAVFAMRERSAARVEEGLAAVAMIERQRVDYRDILGGLSLLHHAAERIGAGGGGRHFEAAARLAEPETAVLIRQFAALPPEKRDIRNAWGVVEIEAAGGPGFLQAGFDRYEPTLDLQRAALEIAALIDADRYQSSVTLAENLPPVWLRAEADPSIERVLKSLAAGAVVGAFLRPGEHPRAEEQHLWAWLVETADENDGRTLLAASRAARHETNVVLGLVEGRLFCLLVAGSIRMGVESMETAESLARFSDGIARILAHHAHPD